MFFVHWVHGDKSENEIGDELQEKLNRWLKRSTADISANIVDKSGESVGSHQEIWGPVGIVFQGIPTLGSYYDVSSQSRGENRNQRMYPTTLGMNSARERTSWDIDSHDIGYEPEADLATDGHSRFIDFSLEDPFGNISSDYPYQWDEWLVVPKKIIAIVIEDLDPSIEEYEIDINKLINVVRIVSKKYSIPLFIGKDRISKLYRNLYGNNQ